MIVALPPQPIPPPRRGGIIVEVDMPGTYSQLYVQIVFAVAGRESIIDKTWRDELHKYISLS